ncbi:hypothetical protein MILUP08_45195 [Micromonospora lupini str. Lupac 08]|uniref:Uncharacterized protein n=1 Tax=Micromonospora lupini str. Lupac 08 TaxID=1150864 RepID=I0L916_9ACTN|nr:hypothetical protein MILUP08_45195 [Micromonospora lupini str. Lupac 08]
MLSGPRADGAPVRIAMSRAQAPPPGASAPVSSDARDAGTAGRLVGAGAATDPASSTGAAVAGAGGPAVRVATDQTSRSGAG